MGASYQLMVGVPSEQAGIFLIETSKKIGCAHKYWVKRNRMVDIPVRHGSNDLFNPRLSAFICVPIICPAFTLVA